MIGTIPTQEKIDTSRDSRNMLVEKRSKYRKAIVDYISAKNGATCDEVEVALCIRHQTASCFIRFMTQEGRLEATAERRITRANRRAIVWRIKREAPETQMAFA
jgi:predicted transcriptional regulator